MGHLAWDRLRRTVGPPTPLQSPSKKLIKHLRPQRATEAYYIRSAPKNFDSSKEPGQKIFVESHEIN